MEPCERTHANTMPTTTPIKAEMAVRPMVQTTPVARIGHCASTAPKSSSTRMVCARGQVWVRCLLGQVASRAAQPLDGHLVQVTRLLAVGKDLVDLQAQLVFALAHADEVGRVFQQQLVLG